MSDHQDRIRAEQNADEHRRRAEHEQRIQADEAREDEEWWEYVRQKQRAKQHQAAAPAAAQTGREAPF